jgi:hypothetical protein
MPNGEQHKEFGPPEGADLASLTDGRKPGDFLSRYSCTAWVQIVIELVYLFVVLVGSIWCLILIAGVVVLGSPRTFFPEILGTPPDNLPMLVWASAGFAGLAGGAASALKWLYHSVAKQQWRRDRVVWRVVVPPLSSVLAVFAGLMIVSGLIPFFSKTPFESPATGAAFGFFVGLFSDNLLASLQKLAYRIFGTVDKGGE